MRQLVLVLECRDPKTIHPTESVRAGNPKLETRNSKLETRNSKPETRNLELQEGRDLPATGSAYSWTIEHGRLSMDG